MGPRLPHRRHPHTLGTRTHTTGHHRQRRPVCHHRPRPTRRGPGGDRRPTRATSHTPRTFATPHDQDSISDHDHTHGDDTHFVATTSGAHYDTCSHNAQTMPTTITADDANTWSRPNTGSTPSDHDHPHDDAESPLALPDTGHFAPSCG